ncbi:MAG: hypothetical protein AB7W37_15805 [Syntrophobacteraceae bacterium]
METNKREKIGKAIGLLHESATKIRRLESEAKDALFSRDDAAEHRKKLQEKAMLLMDLPDVMEEALAGMDDDAAEDILMGVRDFARRAGQAMGLSSIFYMSALLYPDDYREGDQNDFEKFVDALQNRHLK